MIADIAWPLALGLGAVGVVGGLLLGRARVRDEQRSARLQRAWTQWIDRGYPIDRASAYECSCGAFAVSDRGDDDPPTCSVGHESRVMRMVAEP